MTPARPAGLQHWKAVMGDTKAQRPLAERLRIGRRRERDRLRDAEAPGGSNLDDLVVITGFSGAGKSTAMKLFEDAGYFCVDNLPAEMIRSLAELFTHPGSKVERAAVVSDVRAGAYFDKLVEVVDGLDDLGIPHRVLFLEANEQDLLTRYKETRRRHPLSPEGNVADAVEQERELLRPLKDRADCVIDTTGLSPNMLRRKIAAELLEQSTPGRLAVTFSSFGHKHGPPRDADLAFDVRFLPNPHWEPDLRPLTGYDSRIAEYVGGDGRLQEFYDRVIPLLEYLLPQYVAEGKAHLVVAIGCTGGRHRSVVIAEHLASHFRSDDRYFIEIQHRDVDRAPTRA
jgi:RNase adapter protein RapZ